jgi:hypothetical protein
MENELKQERYYRRGDNGPGVKRVQEWLNLHGFALTIDSDFGPRTELVLRQFQDKAGLPVTGVADPATFTALVAPMRAALSPIVPKGPSLGHLVVAYAQQHLAQHPREVGGQNRGPWVRLYMDGHEGKDWAWCAGFATYCLQQAATALKMMPRPLPLARTYSCDELAAAARRQKRLLSGPLTQEQRNRITPGSLFLVRREANDWNHTGIVVATTKDGVHTIEGNTNDEGSREGYEVCARERAFGPNLDFALL